MGRVAPDRFEDKLETTEAGFRHTRLSKSSKLDAPRGDRIEKLCCPSGPPLFRYTSRWEYKFYSHKCTTQLLLVRN